MSRRSKGPTKKARRRMRRAAARHGFTDVGAYEQWRAGADTAGWRRWQAWDHRRRQEGR